ncbi:ABC transporter permease subunit [Calidifontibacter sp. DB0510]|uniref:Maltose/maltodextrin transport system permease protein n=2 Tax=Metallococcus carri TaxID=1656884 RepID=A0A967B6F1_9MICO|nr:ABC transporter permease subunit [Metallococcus carri]NOP38275.1 ABC transporter permease subunit [Calidifontibacter sp. DB2511S]
MLFHHGKTPAWALAAKWILIALALVLCGYIAMRLSDLGYTMWVVLVAFVAMIILAVYGTKRAVPMKYLLPGLILMLGLQIWPIVYTGATAFSNYGQGHLATKEEATAQDIAYSVQQVAGSKPYGLAVAVKDGEPVATGELYFLLTDPAGKNFVGDAKGLTPLTDPGVKVESGSISTAPGYRILNLREANRRSKDLANFAVPTANGGGIKASGISLAFEGRPTLVWDKKADTITDSQTKQVYVARGARWVPKDGQGQPLPVGWKENVGFQNFKTVFTDPTLRTGFVKVFGWNLAFAALSVLTTFILGMLLALLLNDPRIKGRGLYRSLLILPYAIPVFVSALVWQSMFNQEFGLVNNLTHLNVDWFGNTWAARSAVLLTNLWLGFPYMFIVCTGALQSIPDDVMEAARIDGASPLRMLRSIIMPLLLVAVGPLLIASFAFNFNNFGLIQLLTGGGPFNTGNAQIGSTDLLINMAYRLAINGTSPNYGLASAVAIIIFFIVAVISLPGFLRSKALEEVN